MDPSPSYDGSDEIEFFMRYLTWGLRGVTDEVRLFDFVFEIGQINHAIARDIEEREIKFAGLGRATPIVAREKNFLVRMVFHFAELAKLFSEWRPARAVNRFAINFQPFANRAQIVLAGLWDDAFRGRPYVQEIVPALTDDIHEFENNFARRFPIPVVFPEAPRVVDGRGRFPIIGGDALARNGVIAGRCVVT